MSTGTGRVLPLRVPLAPGEGFDSWLEALARRNGISLRRLLAVLHLPAPNLTRALLISITAPQLREVERLCQLPAHHLDQAVLNAAFPSETRQVRGSRYCPRCLVERDGRWKIVWWLPCVFACTTHRTLLHEACPVCGRLPRRRPPGRARSHLAGVCTTNPVDAPPCGTDLRTVPLIPLPDGSPLLSAQRWVNTLLAERGSAHVDVAMSDLHHLARWLLHVLPHQEVRSLGSMAEDAWTDRPTKAPPDRLAPLNAALTAVITHHARVLLGSRDDIAIRRIQQLRADHGSSKSLVPANMTPPHWAGLSPRLRGRFLRAADDGLGPLDRLRLRACIPTARTPSPGDTPHLSRARHVPQLLWPGWTLRFLPPQGLRVDLFRGIAAALLFLPGAFVRDGKGVLTPLHEHLPNYVTRTLQVINHSGYGEVFPALCRIADYLDEHGSIIDYQQRRTLITSNVLSEAQWQELCFRTNAHPGETSTPTSPGRLLHAQRYVFQLLTGADLTDPRHSLAWKTPGDRSRYLNFSLSLSLAQRDALLQHAQRVLDDLGIDEPVTWQPPEECCHGLDLPGPRLDDIDFDAVRRLVIAEGGKPSDIALQLGVSLTHVRLALERIDQQPREWRPHTPTAAWRMREQARTVLTPSFLQREYLDAGKTFRRIADDTGIPRHVVVEQAKALGFPIYRTRRPFPIDEGWLRIQYLDHKRSTRDIATELGTTDETVRRRLQHVGITLRPQGVRSRTIMTTKLGTGCPRNIRAAVEGTLHGWLRLHRFEITMTFPSMETAANYLGAERSVLVAQFQRLENDLGGLLFHRSAFGKPHRPTARGRALLRSLEDERVRTRMNTALGGKLIPMPGNAVLAAATERVTTRRNPGPPRPFTDIAVTRIRIRRETVTVLQDLLDHQDEESYAAQVRTRTGISAGSISPLFRKLERAGWLTSRPEDDDSWTGRAPIGRGAGRRRIYYTLTPEGRRAATHEIQRRSAQP
ncbi:TniQ family protein [Streptomyces sp. NPDC101152]|uniref:TniQ family protein n=1 Tax=Streptomyces sp. NPDC101152 TaxID=3366116 RepID=UPI0038191D09